MIESKNGHNRIPGKDNEQTGSEILYSSKEQKTSNSFEEYLSIQMEIAKETALLNWGIIDDHWREQRIRKLSRLRDELDKYEDYHEDFDYGLFKEISEDEKQKLMKTENKNFFRSVKDLEQLRENALFTKDWDEFNREMERLSIKAAEVGIFQTLLYEITQKLSNTFISDSDYFLTKLNINNLNFEKYEEIASFLDPRLNGFAKLYVNMLTSYMQLSYLNNSKNLSAEKVRQQILLENKFKKETWFKLDPELADTINTLSLGQIAYEKALKDNYSKNNNPKLFYLEKLDDLHYFFSDIEETGEKLVEYQDFENSLTAGYEEDEKKLLSARIKLSNARAFKQNQTIEKIGINPFVVSLTENEIEILKRQEGVVETFFIYLYLLSPNSVKSKSGFVIDTYKYRDKTGITALHPSLGEAENLSNFRAQLQVFLSQKLGIDKSKVVSAEHIAYNFLYLLNINEELFGDQGPESFTKNSIAQLINLRAEILSYIEGDSDSLWPSGERFGEWVKKIKKNNKLLPIEPRLFEFVSGGGLREVQKKHVQELIFKNINKFKVKDLGFINSSNLQNFFEKIKAATDIYLLIFDRRQKENVYRFHDAYYGLIKLGYKKDQAKRVLAGMFDIEQILEIINEKQI